MDIVKIIGIGLISLIIIIIVKQYRPEFTIYVSLIAGVLILTLIMDKISAIIDLLTSLSNKTSINNEYQNFSNQPVQQQVQVQSSNTVNPQATINQFNNGLNVQIPNQIYTQNVGKVVSPTNSTLTQNSNVVPNAQLVTNQNSVVQPQNSQNQSPNIGISFVTGSSDTSNTSNDTWKL